MNKQNKLIKIGHLNVRSLFTGFLEFSDTVLENNFDIMCITETFLNEDISSEVISIPGYNFIRKDRLTRGGGVGIYVSNVLNVKTVLNEFNSVDGIEYMWLEVRLSHTLLLVGVLYRVPSKNVNGFVEHLDDLLSQVAPIYDNIIILGDVNVDQNFDNPVANCMTSYDFAQLIHEPTRITSTTEKLIDVIFFNQPTLVKNTGTLNADLISDHKIIYCEICLSHQPRTPRLITYRDFKNLDLNMLYIDLNSINWDHIYYVNDIEAKVDFLVSNIQLLFNKHAPFKTARVTKPYAPWLTYAVKEMMKERNRALSKYKNTKNYDDWITYKRLRNMTLSAIRQEKAAYLTYNQNCKDTRKLWKAVNTLNIKQKNYIEIPSNLQNPNQINDYFTSVYSPTNNCPNSVNYFTSNRFDENLSFQFTFATHDNIVKIVNSLKSNAYGVDGISAQMLQICLPVIYKHLTHLINCCLEVGYFPANWKLSIVKPLAKINDPKSYSDLRPISIIPTISKVLEKVIYLQIYEFITINNIVSTLQSGYRKGHSTTSVLLNITDNIINALDNCEACALVLLDFSKAFDTLDHALLCAKLNFYGFDNTSVNFFSSYLANRKQMVFLNNEHSDITSITSGVPQGSVLGPLLFLIYTADIFKCSKYTNMQAFADDTQLFHSFKVNEVNQASQQINEDLSAISNYAYQNNLKLNSSKCSFILYCSNKHRQNLTSNLNLEIEDRPLMAVNSTKNLGLLFDINLRFQNQVSSVIKKCYVSLKLLYANISILNFKMRKKLCECLVLPILNYCNIVYYSCLDQLTRYRLQKVMNSCCRYVFRLKKFDHISHKIKELNWLKVENLYKYHLSIFIHSLLNTSSPPYLREKLSFRYNVHSRSLRFTHKLSPPRFHTALFTRSFSYNAPHVYNNIPDTLKSLPASSFRKKIKKHIIRSQ